MITAVCLECGALFQAQRSTAKYCSAACKLRYNRNRGAALVPDAPPVIRAREVGADEVGRAIANARTCSHAFAQLSEAAPHQLRAGCARVSETIENALENEGW